MDARCPECQTRFAVPAPGPATCPACMHSFAAGEDPALWAEPELRRPEGELLGRMDRYLVRQRLYAGELTGLEQARVPGGEWVPLASRPEYAEVLTVLGVDLGARRISQQNLKGWRKTGSAVRAARPAEQVRAAVVAPEPVDPPRRLPVAAIAAVVAAIALLGFLLLR